MRALGFVVLVLLVGSSCEAPKCTPSNCSGCCDSSNRCQVGAGTQACGASGNTCVACSPVQQCQIGICTGGASGGGAGGGGAGEGGGTGGGVADGGTDAGVVDAGVPVTARLDLDRRSVGFRKEFSSGTWIGTVPQESLLISNGGQQPLTILNATISGPDAVAFSVARPSSTPSLMTREQSFVRVLFTPTQAREYSASLTLTSNAGAPTVVPLTGRGVAGMGATSGANPECRSSSACTSPLEQNGGCGTASAAWAQYTEDGATLAYIDDADGDGKADDLDNCPFASNRDQLDGDGDGVGNSCDNCAAASNYAQLDGDADGQGDSCDSDRDGDGVPNTSDNCQGIPNPNQLDTNSNLLGNVCDNDDDGDGILDTLDVCPFLPNPGNAPLADPRCNADADGDNVSDSFDNCLMAVNSTQLDTDLDAMGDACDVDKDNDGVLNLSDNCPLIRNRDQVDDDGDGVGDVCDARYCAVVDPSNPNPQDCLDPQGPFRLHAGGPVTLLVNERFRLPLFANRNGAAITATWSVTVRPAGSTAAIVNPRGLVGMSRHWEYAYVDGRVPSFTADRAGTYVLQVQGLLGISDRAYPSSDSSTAQLQLMATP